MSQPRDYVFPVNEIILETFGAGPPGVAGETGATGPQGPPGPSGTTGTYINVKDFGAIGDGVVDDTVSINLAITAAGVAEVHALFFPAGTYLVSPDVNGIILVVQQTNFTFFGAGQSASVIKVKNGVDDYISVISDGVYSGSSFIDLTGFQFHDLCIDQNSPNNPMSDVSFGTSPLFNGYPRLAIRVYSGFYGSIWNSRFKNCDNVNTIAVNGGASVIGTWTFHHNIFDTHGGGAAHDHSTIYFHGDGCNISNNTFLGTGMAATTAIETHGSNQNVHHNYVRDFFAVANITGVSRDGSRNLTVDHNQGQGAGVGIALWAYDYQAVAGYAVDGAVISENSIEVEYDKWSAFPSFRFGVSLYAASTGLCRNVKIINNTIRFAPHVATLVSNDNFCAGVGWFRTSAVTQAYPQYVQADLSSSVTINQVVLKLPTTFAIRSQTLTVQGSTDGTSFSDLVASATYVFDPTVSSNSVTIPVTPTSTRYVRILISNNTVNTSGQLASLEVMNTAVGGTDLAASKPTLSTPISEGHLASYVTDGSQTTYWQGVYTDERDIEIVGNTITGSIGPGIFFQPNTFSKRIKIKDNMITNPGDGCPNTAVRVGMIVNSVALGLNDIEVSENRVVDTRLPAHMITKAYDFSGTSVVTGGRAYENSVRCADGAAITPYSTHASAVWNIGAEVVAYQQRYSAARYYCSPSNSRTTSALTQDTLYLSKFTVGIANSFDRIGANVTVTSGATVLRLGIWYSATSDVPGLLLADYGTVSAATTGFKEITISQLLQPGVYWLGVVPQSGTVTITAINQTLQSVGHPTIASLVASDYSGLITAATITGALASSPTIVNLGAFGPMIFLRSA